jgi:hypothetical protein
VSALAISAVALAVVAVLALTLAPLLRRARRVSAEAVAAAGPGARRSEHVRGLGLQSRGASQVRGNGRLTLTDDELRFRMFVPDRETRIPLAAVMSVGSERTWLGKWVGRRLLRVRWRTPEGAEDAMAWEVRDLDGWIAVLGGER